MPEELSFSQTAAKDVTRLERIGAHSHINGLGVTETLQPLSHSNIIGQVKARKALAVLSKLETSNRAILIAGPPSTGKTALGVGLSKQFPDRLFVVLSASSVYSLQLSKTEALTQAIRKCIGVNISEETEVIVGEVVELQIETASTQTSGRLTICTTDMETVYDLGSKMIQTIKQLKLSAGDVIQIDKTNGNITKLGRSMHKSRDYDAISSTTKFVNTPTGELLQRKTVTHTVSLHEMDVINSRQQGFLSLFSGDTGEINSELRQQIDDKIAIWLEEGRATLTPGCLFIDEVHMLDLECFSFLNRALENEQTPMIVMATNKSQAKIRGTNIVSPHGIPYDLLDRLLIVSTDPYSVDELRQILKVRITEEELDVQEDALELLTRISHESTLRYAMNLLSVCSVRSNTVTLSEVEKCYQLFVDVQRSTENLLNTGDIMVEDPMAVEAAS